MGRQSDHRHGESGPHGVAISKATLDPVSWNVHLEADGKDAAGKAFHYVMDGKLENIGPVFG